MKSFFNLFTVAMLALSFNARSQNNDSLVIRKLYDYYLTRSKCYSNLEYLSTKIGGRLSGSPQAAQAVDWAKKPCMPPVPTL